MFAYIFYFFFFFFFNDTATTEIYTLSLHVALPICRTQDLGQIPQGPDENVLVGFGQPDTPDRKSTRLNSSHLVISYAVFCLKKKKPRLRQFARLSRQLPDLALQSERRTRR